MESSNKPIIYQGEKIPINELSADDFVSFLYGILKIIFLPDKITFIGMPEGPGDGGFDINAKNNNNQIICFQCKKYPETILDLPKVANELAKVALRSYLENSDVIEHYIISSGKIKEEVDSAKRASTREKFIEYAIKEVDKKENFKQDKKRIKKKDSNKDFKEIVKSYIVNLNTIHIWSKRQLDSEIGTVYSKTQDLRERYFKVDAILREYPRPDFDEKEYFEKTYDTSKFINLLYSLSELPRNIKSESIYEKLEEDTNVKNIESFKESDNECKSYNIESLYESKFSNLVNDNRQVVLLMADGGQGKTITCKQIFNYYADIRKKIFETELPIYISLEKCKSDINLSINEVLNIHYGTWQSIPSNFLLIFDGLNEVNQFKRRELINQIENLIKFYQRRIKIIITTRKTIAFDSSLKLPFIEKENIFKIEYLTAKQIDSIIEKNFIKTEKRVFINELNKRHHTLNQIYLKPFGIQLIINYFISNKSFPQSLNQLFSDYFSEIYNRNLEYYISINQNIENLPYSSFITYVNELAYLWRIKYNKHSLLEEEAYPIIIEALKELKQDVFGLSNISETDIFALLKKNEIIINENGYLYFQHDLFADYFAAKKFATTWEKENFNELRPSKDLLYFTSFLIEEKKIKFIEEIKDYSVGLMARCALQMGQEIINHTESCILDNIPLKNKFAAITIFDAISILATPMLTTKLREISLLPFTPDKQKLDITFQAKRFLCIMGDEFTLHSIIDEVEDSWAAPFKISGGVMYLWEITNPEAKIKISHDRLIQKKENCLASIETLCAYNVKEDIQLILDAIKNSKNSTIILHGLYYLHDLAPDICLGIIDKSFEEKEKDKDKLYLLDIRFQLKKPEKIEWLINLLANYNVNEDDKIFLFEKARKMLCSIELEKVHIEQIQTLLNKRDRINKHELYQVVTHHKVTQFKELFLDILNKSEDDFEIYCILKYFNSIKVDNELQSKYEPILLKLLEKYKTDVSHRLLPELVYSFSLNNIENNIFDYLFDKFDGDIQNYNLKVKEEANDRMTGNKKKKKTTEEIKEYYNQEHKIFNYILCLSYCFKENNAKKVLLKIFDLIKLPGFNKDDQRKALKKIIDDLNNTDVVDLLKDCNLIWEEQLFIFEIIIEDREFNSSIFEKFKELLTQYYQIGRPHSVLNIIQKLWSTEVYNLIIENLKMFEIRNRNNFHKTGFETFFIDTNDFIINEIFNPSSNVDFTSVMPVEYEDCIDQKLKDIFSFWNECYKQKNYLF